MKGTKASSFHHVVDAREQQDNNARQWLQAGAEADRLAGELESDLAGTPDAPVMHFDAQQAGLALAAIELAKQNRQLRFAVSIYRGSETDEALQAMTRQFEASREAYRLLEGKFAGEQAEKHRQFQTQVEEYIARC
ncbi:methyl-accepting chemotaxis protein [Stutzerimonas nitrititolerans]|uniref:methyl-accepting chemotaxis protein n=1 Tax=Stutzerimonas nitrititolerans TaxID=2482751 RepID=UPI003F7F0A0F